MSQTCLITDIQKFAVNDGPGFRTNVFLKGCPLRCAWCHNPETIGSKPQIFWKSRLCVQCGACLDACPKGAIEPPIDPAVSQAEGSTYHKIVRDLCDDCLECVAACKYDALEITGTPKTLEEILDEVEQDRPFYENSGGGMTLSGGEPTMHPDFSEALLSQAHGRGLHTCLDTNGFCSWETLERLIQHADIVLYDIKHLDPGKHKKWVGTDNAVILENLERLLSTGQETWVRIPVVPGFNDDLEFHMKAAEFFANLPGRIARLDLLAFHNWCQDKYGWLGEDWPLGDNQAMDPGMLDIPADFYREKGIPTTVGGSGFEEGNTDI